MRLFSTFFSVSFFINISFSQTSFNYGTTNFDVVKKVNVGDQNVSNVFRASNLASLKGIIGSPYRNTFFEIGIIYRNKDSVRDSAPNPNIELIGEDAIVNRKMQEMKGQNIFSDFSSKIEEKYLIRNVKNSSEKSAIKFPTKNESK